MLAVTLATTGGCTQGEPPAPPAATASGSETTPAREFCLVELPASWQAAFDEDVLTHASDEWPTVILTAPDGSMLVHYGYRGTRHDVRWLPSDGVPVVVQAFGPDQQEAQVLGADFDGRYVVYTVTWSFRLFESAWTLYVWDTVEQGEPHEIARSDQTPDGQPVPGPLTYPVIYAGQVAWVQVSADAPEKSSLYRYHIADGTPEVVAYGGVPGVYRMGSWLIWPERVDDTSTLRAISFQTGEPVELPAPLAAVKNPSYLAFGENVVAWVERSLRRMWVWHTGWPEPIVAVTSQDETEYLQWVNVSGDIVAWDNQLAQFALDLRTGGYTQVTPEFGSTTAHGGPYLTIGFAPDRSEGKDRARSEQTVVDTRDLPALPGCPTAPPTSTRG
jgi:hypothetical protein